MAAPATKHIGDLSGKWVLNKTLSDPVDAALSLQGVGWVLRKTIGVATVTIHAKQYTGPPKPGATTPTSTPTTTAGGAPTTYTHVDIEQTATGGIKGNSEARCLDWAARPHSDWLFGNLEARNAWISVEGARSGDGDGGGDGGGEVDPSLPLVLKAHDPAFLADGWLDGEEERKGPRGETLILNYVRNVDKGWSAMQTWGFQTVGGERRYVRNVVCVNGSKMEKLKMVYDYVG